MGDLPSIHYIIVPSDGNNYFGTAVMTRTQLGIDYDVAMNSLAALRQNCVSWPATTQPTALKFGVNLVSKTA
jgi:hypothetical protein